MLNNKGAKATVNTLCDREGGIKSLQVDRFKTVCKIREFICQVRKRGVG